MAMFGGEEKRKNCNAIIEIIESPLMLKLNLEALQILDAIDRRGSFSAAGKELFKVPSTISYTVAKLEEDLGVQLFDRIGRRAVPTAAGRELLKEGRVLIKAASDLECRVRRVASGWETDLAIVVDSIFTPLALQEDISAFCQIADQTRLRISRESLWGTWEALLDRRADLLIGAPGDGPSGGGYISEPIGTLDFVFAVSPQHPLATVTHSLDKADLLQHQAIAVADSARLMPARTVGLLLGQKTLTVPDMQTKYAYQVGGLGFGFLPEPIARPAILAGKLVEKQVHEPRAPETFYLAWRTGEEGAALSWWISRLRARKTIAALIAG